VVHGVTSALPLASVLPTILFVGLVLAAIVGVMSLASRNDIYDEIGGGGLSMEREDRAEAEGDGTARNPALVHAERELEIRQLLEARSARAVRNGGEPLDVEGELARLLALEEPHTSTSDDASGSVAREQAEREMEVRQMLEARSARMVRSGGEPLDVEAELARLLRIARGADDRV